MAKDFDTMEDSNRSANPTSTSVVRPGAPRRAARRRRRARAAALFAPLARRLRRPTRGARRGRCSASRPCRPSSADALRRARGLRRDARSRAWGEPIGVRRQHAGTGATTRANSAADQAVQMGMHHDGIHYYPLDGSSTRGLLVMNHEYTDDGLLHRRRHEDLERREGAGRRRPRTASSVIEVELKDGALADGAAVAATRAASPRTRRSRSAARRPAMR